MTFSTFPAIAHAVLLGLALQTNAVDPVSGVMQALRSKDMPLTMKRADAALKTHPNDPRLWTLKGMALSGETPPQTQKALVVFRHALKLAPNYLPALESAAQTEFSIGDPAARTHLEAILAVRPDEPTANAMLGSLEYRASDFSSAAKHFNKAGDLLADQPLALSQYAASLANSGQLAEAVPVFAELLRISPEDAAAAYNLALAEFRLKRPEEALRHLEPRLFVDSPSEDALTLAAEINESLGNTQAALDALRRAILLHPTTPDAYLYLAHLSFAHSSPQVGIDILNAGISQMPRESRLYVARGILRFQTGESDTASEDFDRAGSLDPTLSTTETARGIAQSQQHNDKQALITFRSATQQHPNDAIAYYLLAEALSDNNPDSVSQEGKEEVKSALRALQLDPQMKAAHDLLATIYLREGNFAAAAEHSEAALQLDPSDQQAIYHLLMAARKGVNKEQLPSLVKRLADAKSAAPDPIERPRGYLVEAK